MLQFHAILWKATIDHEGEAKVTFTVPLSDRTAVTELMTMTEKLLIVEVREAEP